MKQYFESQIKSLIAKHTELTDQATTSEIIGDKEMKTLYQTMAASIWDRKCDTESHLKEWERQNVSDLALVSGPTKVEVLSLWLNIDSFVRVNNPDGSNVSYTIPHNQGNTIIEKATTSQLGNSQL